MRPCAGGHKRVSEPSCYQKMSNPSNVPQALHICRHLFHGFNRALRFAVKTRRLRFFRNQQQCAIQMEAQSKGTRAPCSVDSTANFSLYRGINAQDRLQFSPALVNVIVPAIGSISEIEKPYIRCRHILAMAGSFSLSSVVYRAGMGSSTVEDLLADPRRFVSRIRRDGLYLWGVLDQVPEKRVKSSAVVDVARCHLRLHPRLSQMVCASYHVSPPMSSPGCPYDNAAAENFLGTLKTEYPYRPASPHAPR